MKKGIFLMLFIVINSFISTQIGLAKPNDDLINACSSGDIMQVNKAFIDGADVDAENDNGYTGLMLAAMNGHEIIVNLLIEKGAEYDVDYRTKDKNSYLIAFARAGMNKYVKELLEKEKSKERLNQLYAALREATVTGKTETMKLLMENGADLKTEGIGSWLIQFAILENQLGSTKMLIENGVDVNIEDKNQITPIFYAVSKTVSNEILKYLIDHGANFSANVKGRTPIYQAIANNNLGAVQLLITAGIDIFYQPFALQLAAEFADIEINKLLVENNADLMQKNKDGEYAYQIPDRKKKEQVRDFLKNEFENYKLRNDFFQAIDKNDLESINSFINNGVSLNSKDRFGRSALLHVVWNKNNEVAKYFVSKGADINDNSYGETPLFKAAVFGNKELVDFFIDNGAILDPNYLTKYNENYLLAFCSGGFFDLTKKMIELGSKIDIIGNDEYATTPFIVASDRGNLEILQLLLEKGINVNSKNSKGENGLMWAVEGRQFESVKFLIDKGANINQKDTLGFTAFMLAIENTVADGAGDEYYNKVDKWFEENNQIKLVEYLISKGADTKLKNSEGLNSLMISLIPRYGYDYNPETHFELIKFILNYANLNDQDNLGRTALIIAVENAWDDNSPLFEIINLLIEKGADLNLKNNDGFTALAIAKENSNTKLIELLTSKGAKE